MLLFQSSDKFVFSITEKQFFLLSTNTLSAIEACMTNFRTTRIQTTCFETKRLYNRSANKNQAN